MSALFVEGYSFGLTELVKPDIVQKKTKNVYRKKTLSRRFNLRTGVSADQGKILRKLSQTEINAKHFKPSKRLFFTLIYYSIDLY